VIMGKRCIWDNFYAFLKGKWSQIGRRNTSKSVEVPVADGFVSTWYHSPKEVKRLLSEQMELDRIAPVGLHVPPSFLAPFFEKRPKLLNALNRLDNMFTHRLFSNLADHYYVRIIKK